MSAVPSTPQRSSSLAQFLLRSESLPSGTPVRSNSSQFAYDKGQPLPLHDRRSLLAEAMHGYTIGRKKYKEFLEEFVPKAPTPTPDVRYRLGPLVNEASLYNPLLKGVNRVLKRATRTVPYPPASSAIAVVPVVVASSACTVVVVVVVVVVVPPSDARAHVQPASRNFPRSSRRVAPPSRRVAPPSRRIAPPRRPALPAASCSIAQPSRHAHGLPHYLARRARTIHRARTCTCDPSPPVPASSHAPPTASAHQPPRACSQWVSRTRFLAVALLVVEHTAARLQLATLSASGVRSLITVHARPAHLHEHQLSGCVYSAATAYVNTPTRQRPCPALLVHLGAASHEQVPGGRAALAPVLAHCLGCRSG
ncbi:uncharacterized protein SCHCODRAFT_02681520 [Schizophyllum commune H4-8]|uniref:uncharacterized protein n=1 Tax=Schizophyllum commune (strain H4-8 / FGSC 9210) TaxID=578458 RepID=UPI00215F6E62|nr:uncharacterized protein SCHCODRAFT_02681520 [Schizophyllum commune H4-8]KAI5885969.1 hypothetical protein SCHCODRAFT_02681520 [Schizophyllum commune H4-8]